MRLIINIPDSTPADAGDLAQRATKAFGRCHVEVDRPEGATEAIQAMDSEQFATQARAYLALALRYGQPLTLAAFRFAVPPDRADTLCQALRLSVGGQCRAEDLVYCDGQGQMLMLLPQTPDAAATGFCERMVRVLQCAIKTVGFAHPERIVYCALVAYSAERHGTIAVMMREAYEALEQAVTTQRAGQVVRPGDQPAASP